VDSTGWWRNAADWMMMGEEMGKTAQSTVVLPSFNIFIKINI
jgi:hypothetical protein